MQDLLDFLTTTWIGGIVWILFGIWMFKFTRKYTAFEPNSIFQTYLGGMMTSFGAIICGILIFCFKIAGKL